jgi:hypothetical protein
VNSMGYKVLGYVVWQGTKIFLNRKTPNYMTGRRVGIASLVALGIVGALIAQRSSDS